MNTEALPTLEEFMSDIKSFIAYSDPTETIKAYYANDVHRKMREFTNMHVKAALETVARTIGIGMDSLEIMKCYPKENIK